MKKLITFFALAMLIAGLTGVPAFAGVVDPSLIDSGDCTQCEGVTAVGQDALPAQGQIARGCEGPQTSSGYFDYDDFGKNENGVACTEYIPDTDPAQLLNSYCKSGDKEQVHRAIFEMCECIESGVWNDIVATDTFDISLEILVEKDGSLYNGDNGVYWYGEVESIGVNLATDKDEICEDTACRPTEDKFGGLSVLPGKLKIVADYSDGLNIADRPELVGSSTIYAWIDVPPMYADPDEVDRGDRVWVKVCVTKNFGTEGFTYCEECCCLISIGELCCDETTTTVSKGLIYPYYTELDNPIWWLGMTLANLTDSDGTATLTMYEKDGDMATGTVSVAARKMAVVSNAELEALLTLTTGGTLGDSQSYIIVTGDFDMTGFAMMGRQDTGESMGYLPLAYDK